MSIPAAEAVGLGNRSARDAFRASLAADVPAVGSERWANARRKLTPTVLDAMTADNRDAAKAQAKKDAVGLGVFQLVGGIIAGVWDKAGGPLAGQLAGLFRDKLVGGAADFYETRQGSMLRDIVPDYLARHYQVDWQPAVTIAEAEADHAPYSYQREAAAAYLQALGKRGVAKAGTVVQVGVAPSASASSAGLTRTLVLKDQLAPAAKPSTARTATAPGGGAGYAVVAGLVLLALAWRR